MATLRTDYKNDELNIAVNTERQFEEVTNPNGTKSYRDVTDYTQVGDSFDADLVNSQNAEINSKAPLDSPAFTGNPTAPTQSQSTSDDTIATTSYVKSAFNNFVDPNLRTSGKAADAQATGNRINSVEASIPQIDTSLSFFGQAADAKVVGDNIKELENALNKMSQNQGTIQTVWEQGGINYQNGAEFDSATRIRTSLIDVNPGQTILIDNESGLHISFFYYDNNPSFSSYHDAYSNKQNKIVIPTGIYHIRISAKYEPTANIVPSVGYSIKIFYVPDTEIFQYASNPLKVGSATDYGSLIGNRCTLEVDGNGVCTATSTGESSTLRIFIYMLDVSNVKVNGHKLYVRVDGLDTSHITNFTNVSVTAHRTGGAINVTKTGSEVILEPTADCNVITLYINASATIPQTDYATFTGLQIIDLTEMFGVGFEPTVEEFKSVYGTTDYDRDVTYLDGITSEERVLATHISDIALNAIDDVSAEIDEKLSNIEPSSIAGCETVQSFKDNLVDGEVYGSDGTVTENASWKRTDLYPVNTGDVIEFRNAIYLYAVTFDASSTFVATLRGDGTPQTYKYTVPSGVKYIGINVPKTYEASFDCLLNGVELDAEYTIDWLKLPSLTTVKPDNILECTKVVTFRDSLINGETYDTSGNPITSANWKRSPLYPVNEGDVISVKNAIYIYAIYYDSNKAFVSYFRGDGTPQNYELTVPSGVGYFAINVAKSYESVYSCEVNGFELDAQYRPEWLRSNSIWKNKVYVSHGDSITERDGKNWPSGWPHAGEKARGYQTIFAENVGIKWYTNTGIGGWPMAIYPGRGGIIQKITAIDDYTPYDLCTIASGTNDFKLNIQLGTKGQIGDTTFDDSVFYGAYRHGIEHMLTSNPKLRIVLMTPIQRDNSGYDVNYTNSAGCKLSDYVNAIKEIGEMYGLPVCDMYANSGITKLTLSTYTVDGLHPNSEGYERMGSYLTQFLNGVGL